MAEYIPSTKVARQAKIMQLVQTFAIASQGELQDLLQDSGIVVTQATLSRDLEELQAYKECGSDGRRLYRVPGTGENLALNADSNSEARIQVAKWAQNMVLNVHCVLNQVILRTLPGAAPVLAHAIEKAQLAGMLGTIAGSDTVLIIADGASSAQNILQELMEFLETEN